MNGGDGGWEARACFRARARRLGIVGDDAYLDTLARLVDENDAVMAAVDASARVHSDDPADFVRLMRSWRRRHGD
jgi:hypothetical protein